MFAVIFLGLIGTLMMLGGIAAAIGGPTDLQVSIGLNAFGYGALLCALVSI